MTGFVYFIRAATGPIKIGFSAGPEGRLAALQTSFPERLSILAACPATRKTEKRLHKCFRSTRMHGEWFSESDELTILIALARENQADPAFIDRYLDRIESGAVRQVFREHRAGTVAGLIRDAAASLSMGDECSPCEVMAALVENADAAKAFLVGLCAFYGFNASSVAGSTR